MPRIGRSFPVPPRVTKGPLGAGPTTAIMRTPRTGIGRPAPPRPHTAATHQIALGATTRIQPTNRGALGRPMLNRGRAPTTYQVTASPQPITEVWPRANRRTGPQRPLKGFFPVTPPAQPITEVTPRANRRAGPTKAKPGFVVVAVPPAQAVQRAPTLPVKRAPVPRQQPPRTFIAPQVPALLVRVTPGILAPKPRQPILRQRAPRVYVTPPAAAGFRIRLPMVGVGR
jgi:hypothetical protein